MTNRERYFLKRDEYDIMMTIAKNISGIGTSCVIEAIGGKRPLCKGKWNAQSAMMTWDCETCVQEFLNEEAER